MASSKKGKKFRNHKKWIVFFDRALIVAGVFSIGLFRPDYVVIASYFLAIPYLIFTKRTNLLNHLMVASGLAALWMLIANGEYRYNMPFLNFHGLSLYSLFAWAIGLFAVYILYFHFEHIFRWHGYSSQVLLLTAFYWPLLIAVETLAYHIFYVVNMQTAGYPGLPLCDCIHAPLAMQIAYLAMGPIFFTLCFLFGLERSTVGKKARR